MDGVNRSQSKSDRQPNMTKKSSSPAPEPRGRGRPKVLSDAKQAQKIARQARSLFLKNGYARTSMDDVVMHCRISKSTLYRLFTNKKELFAAIIDDHRLDMLVLPGDYDDMAIEDALAHIFRIDIDSEANEERLALMRFAVVESQQFPELGPLLYERGPGQSLRELALWLADQCKKGRINVPNADDAAMALMDMMFGPLIRIGEQVHASRHEDDRARYLRNCISMFVRGILPRAAARARRADRPRTERSRPSVKA